MRWACVFVVALAAIAFAGCDRGLDPSYPFTPYSPDALANTATPQATYSAGGAQPPVFVVPSADTLGSDAKAADTKTIDTK